MLDKIIANRLWWFVTTNKLINNRQFGFKKGSSTIDSLLYIDYQISNCLSLRKHTTIISLDFERAFDKVGIHSILEQLTEWKVGPKIIGYVKNFMTNRKICVQVNNFYSNSLPLHNGIPQGSPLSVVLFVIAYNKLSSIIEQHKEVDFCAYADDFNLIIRSSREKNINLNLDNLFNNINLWCDNSGATLSTTKCKYLHICRLQNCNCSIRSSNILISKVDSLRILGVFINSRYKWNDHIEYLRTSLSNRLNIIKCLASRQLNCNTLTLISIVKALIISKINYGLSIFGSASKTLLKKITTIMNSAIRISLGALPSTPINNMLFESNILTLNTQIKLQTTNNFRSLLYGTNTPINQIVKKLQKSKKIPKVPSTIYRTIVNCKGIGLIFSDINSSKHSPPWTLDHRSMDLSLHRFFKTNSDTSQFKIMFSMIKDSLNEYKFLYTDGSKTTHFTTFSITTEDNIISMSHLPIYSSIFSAELIAIHGAITYAIHEKGKFAICTDSLSSINSIGNISNKDYYTSNIRTKLIQHFPNIILIWVPGHCGIKGNEFADYTAKMASKHPLHTTQNINRKDLVRFINKHYIHNDRNNTFNLTSNWYRTINVDQKSIYDILTDKTIDRRLDYIKYSRLRLGHTRATHGPLFYNTSTPFCDCTLHYPTNPSHVFTDCPKTLTARKTIFQNTDPLYSLSHPSSKNIELVTKFLKQSTLYKEI